ncbi:uncharacterized protein LOC108590274 isoform X4 [Callithrix jacchus]|uniref:serine/arginine repetitive matrix protein 1-like isoform X4 n=1 Tax=Callithrix jacchus TaxID=9483 RepID=UPI0023DD4451|nr:serine/arginine repetitive matrix protein 1-like isoform X4 [Callithrix jacchus]
MSPSTHSCGSRPAGEGESERGGAGAAEGLPGRWRGSRGAAGGGGRGRAVARRPAGSSREPAGRAEPEPQPERGGGGRSQSGRRLCRRSRGAATLAPRPPPRSLALTPGRRRRAARAPPAPHGRPRHWALRPPRRCPARSSAPRRVPERSHCSRRRPRENTERSLPTHPPLSPQEPLICFRSRAGRGGFCVKTSLKWALQQNASLAYTSSLGEWHLRNVAWVGRDLPPPPTSASAPPASAAPRLRGTEALGWPPQGVLGRALCHVQNLPLPGSPEAHLSLSEPLGDRERNPQMDYHAPSPHRPQALMGGWHFLFIPLGALAPLRFPPLLPPPEQV